MFRKKIKQFIMHHDDRLIQYEPNFITFYFTLCKIKYYLRILSVLLLKTKIKTIKLTLKIKKLLCGFAFLKKSSKT